MAVSTYYHGKGKHRTRRSMLEDLRGIEPMPDIRRWLVTLATALVILINEIGYQAGL